MLPQLRDKIEGIIRSQIGTADEHAPGNADLMSYWVRTKNLQRDSARTEMTAEAALRVQPGADFMSLLGGGAQLNGAAFAGGQVLPQLSLSTQQALDASIASSARASTPMEG